jgi:hypothetical protein
VLFHLRTLTAAKLLMGLVPRVGVEPARSYEERILSPRSEEIAEFLGPVGAVKRAIVNSLSHVGGLNLVRVFQIGDGPANL